MNFGPGYIGFPISPFPIYPELKMDISVWTYRKYEKYEFCSWLYRISDISIAIKMYISEMGLAEMEISV
jgi:hypothetical protein